MSRAFKWIVGLVAVAAAGLVMTVPAVGAAPFAVVDGMPVDVNAERLEVDLRKGTAILTGDVRIRRGELEIKCERVEARYDEAPHVTWAKATGGVTAQMGALRARAGEAELELRRKTITLRGEVLIERGGASMSAKEAQIDLDTQRVILREVKGRIPIPSALPASSKSP